MSEAQREEDQAMKAEMAFRNARKTIEELGYNTIQEAIADLLIEGEYNKSEGTWTAIEDVSNIRTDRVYMNKAQAKFYGLEIVEPK